jgi:hypothetical protein
MGGVSGLFIGRERRWRRRCRWPAGKLRERPLMAWGRRGSVRASTGRACTAMGHDAAAAAGAGGAVPKSPPLCSVNGSRFVSRRHVAACRVRARGNKGGSRRPTGRACARSRGPVRRWPSGASARASMRSSAAGSRERWRGPARRVRVLRALVGRGRRARLGQARWRAVWRSGWCAPSSCGAACARRRPRRGGVWPGVGATAGEPVRGEGEREGEGGPGCARQREREGKEKEKKWEGEKEKGERGKKGGRKADTRRRQSRGTRPAGGVLGSGARQGGKERSAPRSRRPVGHSRRLGARERDAQVEGKQGAGYGCRVFGESGGPAEQGGFRTTGVRVSRRDLELNDEQHFSARFILGNFRDVTAGLSLHIYTECCSLLRVNTHS